MSTAVARDVSLSMLMNVKQSIQKNSQKIVKVQHFNIVDNLDYSKLIRGHSITVQDYEETFYDTKKNDLMKRSIWCKKVLAGKKTWYIIKFSVKKEGPLCYIEVRAETMSEMKEVVLTIVDMIDKSTSHDMATRLGDPLKEYYFPVVRYTLIPKATDSEYKITIDNMMCKDTFYTVCAVQTQCTMEQVDEFSNQVNAHRIQSKIKTTRHPALSKIGFYLRELHPCLFGELKHIFGTHPFNTDVVFSIWTMCIHLMEPKRTQSTMSRKLFEDLTHAIAKNKPTSITMELI